MAFWARTTKNLRRPGDIEHAIRHSPNFMFLAAMSIKIWPLNIVSAKAPQTRTPFCTPNRHFFIWFRHIANDFVILSLVLNRGSHYEQVHAFMTQRATVWLGSYIRQRAFDFGEVFSLVEIECPLPITWPKSNCGALHQTSVQLSKKTAPISNKCEGDEVNWDAPKSNEKVSIRRAKWCILPRETKFRV